MPSSRKGTTVKMERKRILGGIVPPLRLITRISGSATQGLVCDRPLNFEPSPYDENDTRVNNRHYLTLQSRTKVRTSGPYGKCTATRPTFDHDLRPPTHPLGLESTRMDGEESNPAPGRPQSTSSAPWSIIY
ncbi:hypothetical protein AVEN_266367-1 [Araneus ventricosus]|uniref:Uncharacterized protein n=1 Tax=Araneus ventricosus TaxID=182803 RepID=A0A4Y2CRK2_ARAVE|nr:hypothetical protein AVEN_266367-1 [Araneus ventricosus]